MITGQTRAECRRYWASFCIHEHEHSPTEELSELITQRPLRNVADAPWPAEPMYWTVEGSGCIFGYRLVATSLFALRLTVA